MCFSFLFQTFTDTDMMVFRISAKSEDPEVPDIWKIRKLGFAGFLQIPEIRIPGVLHNPEILISWVSAQSGNPDFPEFS